MKKIALAAALTTAVAGAAYAAENVDVTVDGASFTPTSITFPEVTIDQPGYLAMYEASEEGAMVPDAVGHMLVEEGTTTGVTVPIEGGVENGVEYVAVLHAESNGNTEFDYRAGQTMEDAPIMGADGEPFAKPFMTQM